MELIKANSICYNNGRTDILDSASFRIIEGGHYGLIGPNGVGKTTLVRIIKGELEIDSGTLYRKKGLRIGYVPQMQEFGPGKSIAEFMLTDIAPLGKRLTEIEEKMASASGDGLDRLLAEYQKASGLFEKAGGYEAAEKGEAFLARLGLDNPPDQKMETLSGGERSLVWFARALISDPELLILDEPGNHLDYLGLAWLESFLAGYRKTVLIVSHNRYLLDRTCRHLIPMNTGKLDVFTGSYSEYRRTVLRKAVYDRNAYESGRRKIAALEKTISRLQSIAMSQYNPPVRIMNQLAAAKRKLAEDRAKLPEKPELDRQSIHLDINAEASKSDTAVRITEYSLAFGQKVLLENANMEVLCGQSVALVGPNGCGKSSLLKKLMDEGDWHHKHLKIGPSQKIAYLSQVPVFSDNAVTIEDEVRSWGPLTRDDAFSIISRFSFGYEDMDKRLAVLSGGETGRLQLARFSYFKTNLLILDEPTNHMDLISREVIEEALERFEGTMLIVSHDRFFLDTLVSRVYEFNDRKLECYEGNFSEYFMARYPVLPRLSGSVTGRASERIREKSRQQKRSPDDLESRIGEAENEKKAREKEMKEAFDSNNQEAGRRAAARLGKISSLLDKLYEEWERALD
ncbi:MAG: ABC-F family ATP-binding cassette domain-containing protein [Spirochaetales bacterium]|nr:ABC-F family ATP-binding cassette domain-containing protein [Spirochaetales bacterium]